MLPRYVENDRKVGQGNNKSKVAVERQCPRCGAVVKTYHSPKLVLRSAVMAVMPCCLKAMAVEMPTEGGRGHLEKLIAEIDAKVQGHIAKIENLRKRRAWLLKPYHDRNLTV